MEQNSQKQNFAKGIYLTKRKSKAGREFLELSIKTEKGYDKYICFESKNKDYYGNEQYSVLVKESNKESNKLPDWKDVIDTSGAADLPF